MATENRSEQATPRRKQKAREEGRVARSRELATSFAIAVIVFVIAAQMARGIGAWKRLFQTLVVLSCNQSPTPLLVFGTLHTAALYWVYPALGAAMVISLAVSSAQGGLLFAPALLKPVEPDQSVLQDQGISFCKNVWNAG